MAGTLYLCATPIGNLEDITLRVLRVLREADLIAAEDTRVTMRLLNHFQIRTPITSYHEHNKTKKGAELAELLLSGEDIALVTDAGTPLLSDPGEDLVRLCHKQGIAVTSLPGPSACVTALTVSGLPAGRFCFEGFLPRDGRERSRILSELSAETRTIVIYESPRRLLSTLRDLFDVLGERDISVCRELSKIHEEVRLLSLSAAIARYDGMEVRGECVILIRGADPAKLRRKSECDWLSVPVAEHVNYYLSLGLSKKDAMKQAARDRGVGKSDIYRACIDADTRQDPRDGGIDSF